jgi:hypothetical protein
MVPMRSTPQCSKARTSRSSTILVVARGKSGDRGACDRASAAAASGSADAVGERFQASELSGLPAPACGNCRGPRPQAWTSEFCGNRRELRPGKTLVDAPSHPAPPRPRASGRSRRAIGHLDAMHLRAYDRTRCGDPVRRHREGIDTWSLGSWGCCRRRWSQPTCCLTRQEG